VSWQQKDKTNLDLLEQENRRIINRYVPDYYGTSVGAADTELLLWN